MVFPSTKTGKPQLVIEVEQPLCRVRNAIFLTLSFRLAVMFGDKCSLASSGPADEHG
jgi:hypothetical protein